MGLSLRRCAEFAVDAAWQAGKITQRYFQAGVDTEWKEDASPVTIADREAEQKLRQLEEAGGTFTDWSGKPTIYGKDAFSTNGHIFDAVMAHIEGE